MIEMNICSVHADHLCHPRTPHPLTHPPTHSRIPHPLTHPPTLVH